MSEAKCIFLGVIQGWENEIIAFQCISIKDQACGDSNPSPSELSCKQMRLSYLIHEFHSEWKGFICHLVTMNKVNCFA